MKVLFVTPPIGAWATHGNHCAPNQFHAQMIAYIREKKLGQPLVIDARASGMDFSATIEKIIEIKPEVIFLGEILHSTGGLAPIWYFIETARAVKALLPETKIVVGGLWFSALFEDTLKKYTFIDFVIIGEPELTLEELLIALRDKKTDFSNIAGLASQAKENIIVGPHRNLIQNLDILPTPAYDLFPMDKYVGHTHWKPFCELLVSRGCPGGCNFCYEWSQYDPRSPQDFVSWRIKSADKILDELEVLNKTYGVKVIVFQDDAFNVNKQVVEDVCRGMIKRNIKMNWVILGRADHWIKQIDILPLMKESGLFMGLLGVEVESDEELRKIGKGITVKQIVETINALRKHGIMSIGTFMIGFESDDEPKVKRRFEFANEVDPDILALQFFTPVPGSPIWPKYVERGWINPNTLNIKTWDFQHPVVPTNYLSKEDVGRLGSWCMREFFSVVERVERLFTGPYHELARLCVRDFIENINKFEKAATGQDEEPQSQVDLIWDQVVESKLKAAVVNMPFFYRTVAEKMVRQQAENLARKRNSLIISEEDMVLAFFKEVPGPFKGMMKDMLKKVGVEYTKYIKE